MERRLALVGLVLVSTTALFLGCEPSSTGVVTGPDTGARVASSGAGTGSSGATAESGAGSTLADGSMSGTSSIATSGSPGSDAGTVDDATVDDGQAITDGPGPPANWVLSWSDEFNGAAGTPPDPAYWSYDLGGGGWGVTQLQTYTNSAANAAMDGIGHLAIVAIKDAAANFTSARIKTQGKFEQAFGRFEIRAKAVTGNGMWPAFWMLGNNFNSAGWPQCGEIDIMEIRGTLPYKNGGSLHGPGYSGMHPLSGSFSLPDGGPKLSDDFHTYAVEWETGVVRFYVDTNLFETRTPADVPTDAGPAMWVYDHPFFILVNVAVGGMYPGPPTGTVFPQTMLVDYVRAYKRPNTGG